MFYATLDSEDGKISEEAMILPFKTQDAAEEWLHRAFSPDEYHVMIVAGTYGDCWKKRQLSAVAAASRPFAADDVIVRGPGDHPGGQSYWITPVPDVLVVRTINKD